MARFSSPKKSQNRQFPWSSRQRRSSATQSRHLAFTLTRWILTAVLALYLVHRFREFDSSLQERESGLKEPVLSTTTFTTATESTPEDKTLPLSSSSSHKTLPSSKKETSQPDEIQKQPRGWDSSRSAVMGLAVGYGLDVFRLFVGSLRATGFKGKIHLGIQPDAPPDVLQYLQEHDVAVHPVHRADRCTYFNHTMENGALSQNTKCPKDYPDYKFSWGRFPLYRDWLLECKECTDGVLLTDVRDAFFQGDPFRDVVDPQPLYVFEEHPNTTTEHWLADVPVKKCRNFTLGPQPMLCSGSLMGSREGILEYIGTMVREFDFWNTRANCRSDMAGDDQSIHNYLYYTHQLNPKTVAVPHRTGPIHVVGYQANRIFRSTIQEAFDKGHGKDLMEAESYVNSHRFHGSDETNWRDWLGPQHNLTDPHTGYILNVDGRPSAQVHQHDRFGFAVNFWLKRMVEEWNTKTKPATD